MTEGTITDGTAVFEELDGIRERGYATDDEERIRGVRCVGTALTDEDDGVVGAESVSRAKRGMHGEQFNEELPELVLRAANVIEVDVKHQNNCFSGIVG